MTGSGKSLRLLSMIFLFTSVLFFQALPYLPALPVYSAELFYPMENTPDFYSAPEFGGGEAERAEKADEGKRDLLKEAVFIFSGMLYGFEFKYIPGDIRRNVEEVFEIEPIGTIKWGDPRLSIRGSRSEENRVFISFSYQPDESMKSWIMYWSSGAFPLVGGKAEGAFLPGFKGKEDAVRQGIKEALRAYMRSREHNKPQKIEGEFVFASPPVYSYAAGIYTASVKLKFNIENVSRYGVY